LAASAHLSATALQRHVARLRRRHQVQSRADAFILRDGSLVLAADSRRLYERHFPRPSDHAPAITRDFLATTKTLDHAPLWLWAAFGLTEWLPRTARLRHASLQAGACRLSFRLPDSGGGEVTLGTCALADRLLARQTLPTWAQDCLPGVRQNPGGTWSQAQDSATYTAQTRRRRHELTLSHDRVHNQIHWTHRSKTAKP
jgi:hypothetical protein